MCLLLTSSCKKDFTGSEASNKTEGQANSKLSGLKSWFENHENEIRHQDNWLNSFSPNWEMLTIREENGLKIYEIALHNPQKVFSTSQNLNAENKEKLLARSLLKLLLFEDDQGNCSARFMEITAFNDYPHLQLLGYKDYQHFSGMVNFYHFNGQLANGWIYNKGQLTGRIGSATEKPVINVSDKIKTESSDGCVTIDIEHWKLKCISTPGIIEIKDGGGYEKCTWESNVETRTVYCETSGGGNGGSGGGGITSPSTIDLYFLDRIKYPVLAKIIDGLYNKVASDQKLMNALKKFTKLSTEQILQNLKSGQGPKLVVEKNQNRAGGFDRQTNIIYISEHVVTANNYMVKNYSTALELYITVSVLHEFVHFGENYSQVFLPYEGDYNDAGFQFENQVYGGRVYFNYLTGAITYEKI